MQQDDKGGDVDQSRAQQPQPGDDESIPSRFPRRDSNDGKRGALEQRRSNSPEADEVGQFEQVPIEGIEAEELLDLPQIEVVQAVRHWKGPLPEPDVLRAYEQIHPGAAKEILDDFRRQSVSVANVMDASADLDHAKADGIRSLSRAQAHGTRVGAWTGVGGLVLVAFGGVLTAFGVPNIALFFTAIPGVLIAAGGFVSTFTGRKQGDSVDIEDI